MRHETIEISGAELETRWNCDDKTAAEVAGLECIVPDASYEVSWPDHVSTPKFNGDCSIRQIS